MKAARVGEDSSIQRMIRLVQSADAKKAKIVGIADRWATWIVVIALTAAVLTWLFTGEPIRAVTILVVFCPCALVLATPTAIMAAIWKCHQTCFVVREEMLWNALQVFPILPLTRQGLSLTENQGSPLSKASCRISLMRSYTTVPHVRSYILSIPWEKPLYSVIKRRQKKEPKQPEQFRMIPGRGVQAVADGKEILGGNQALLAEGYISIPESAANELKNI